MEHKVRNKEQGEAAGGRNRCVKSTDALNGGRVVGRSVCLTPCPVAEKFIHLTLF